MGEERGRRVEVSSRKREEREKRERERGTNSTGESLHEILSSEEILR